MTTTEHRGACYYLNQICTCKTKILLGLVVFLLIFYFFTGRPSAKFHDNNFDYLLFTQRWIPTACIQYVERPSAFSRRCTLPVNFKMWAVHGLWPTVNGGMGPFFCNRSLPFDINALRSIQSDLMAYWPNIEGNAGFDSLWRHEWEKHGTCAAQLDFLDTEFKYFSNTLGLYKKYNIGNILERNNVVPSLRQGYSLSHLFDVFQKTFGKMVQIHCIYEIHTNQPYLSEIRMCFDKNLNLIDCNEYKHIKGSRFDRFSALTNCPHDARIIYPDTPAPPAYINDNLKISNEDFRQQLFHILQLVKFVQWILL